MVSNNRSVFSQEVRNQQSRCGQGWFLPDALRETLFHASLSWWLPGNVGAVWLVDAALQSLPPSSLDFFFVPLYSFLSLRRTLSLDLGTALIQYVITTLHYVCKDPLCKQGHTNRFQGFGCGRTFALRSVVCGTGMEGRTSQQGLRRTDGRTDGRTGQPWGGAGWGLRSLS